LLRERHQSRTVSGREALVLGVGLSLNNVGSGVGAGIAGISPLATTLLAGALSLICVGGGSRVGWPVGRLVVGHHSPLVAGLVLVVVGTATLSGAG
jgi:putative Mn2+ efflux pump MntP